MKFTLMILFTLLCCFTSIAQKRLELLETNIDPQMIGEFTDSYLWTKNWWLTAKMVPDTSRGGNAWSISSKLNKSKVDSMSKLFTKYVSPDIIRFGNLLPRIEYRNSSKQTLHIKSSLYEIRDTAATLIAQFLIEFSTSKHNKMADVHSISIIDPADAIAYPHKQLLNWYNRKATAQEQEMTPPAVERMQ